jgi:3-keto-disaccharide hydrolase
MTMIMATALASGETINFDDMKIGATPAGWTATQTGSGTAKWAIEKDDSAPSKPNVLRQSGQATFPVCFKNNTSVKDGFVEVKFKPIAGKEDQGGGVIWRVQDANNYYVSRANALEDNVTIYHTVNGRRIAFKNFNTKVTSGVWHTIRVEFQGSNFSVTFDGNKVIEATDTTFANAGKVGVWTKADSVILFDDFTYGSK